MKIIFFSFISTMLLFIYNVWIIQPSIREQNKVLYSNIFYDLSNYSIIVLTNKNDYDNSPLESWKIYFLWNDNLKNDYNWKKIDDLNLEDYNKLVNYNYKYFENNLVFQKW